MLAVFRFILTKLWPLFIPAILYFIWLSYMRRKGKNVNRHQKKLLKLTIISTVLIAIGLFIFSFIDVEQKTENYIPTKIENGKIVPSKVE